jgi:hypothetical protein
MPHRRTAATWGPRGSVSGWLGALVVVLVAALLPAVAPAAVATTAQATATATMQGHDISWPQCPVAVGGFGNPMPPTSTQFVVVGLTFGLPFTTNPCLADQLAWTATNGKPAMPYTMSAFPTAQQLTTYGSQGPWSPATRAGQLSNVGYAEAAYAEQTLASASWAATTVWVDVERRDQQPWPTATTAQRRENRYVIEGLLRGLRDAGRGYGLYANQSDWQTITGTWWLPGVPAWATSGTLDTPNEALDKCSHAAVSGGHVYLSQWWDSQRDYDLTCTPWGFTGLTSPGSALSRATGDFNGDWANDVLARVSATGELRVYAGADNGSLATAVGTGTTWRSFDWLDTPGDVNGDGRLDVMARQASTGYLWLYPGNGTGGWLPRVRVGTGWGIFSAIVGPGDFNGDQRVDLLARERSTGYLWLYRGNGAGGWLPRVRAGTGWGIFNAFLGPGDVNGDGTVDLLARETSTGYLWLYPGNGTGGWLPRVRIGSFKTMTALMSPGDLNGDRVPDVLARDASGVLWLYPRTTSGTWLPRSKVSTGWNSLNAIF